MSDLLQQVPWDEESDVHSPITAPRQWVASADWFSSRISSPPHINLNDSAANPVLTTPSLPDGISDADGSGVQQQTKKTPPTSVRLSGSEDENDDDDDGEVEDAEDNIGASTPFKSPDVELEEFDPYLSDPLQWCQGSDPRQIARRLYQGMQKWIHTTSMHHPLLLFAIPKYKRTGEPNKRWNAGILRVHAALHRSHDRSQENKSSTMTIRHDHMSMEYSTSNRFAKQSVPSKLRNTPLWETSPPPDQLRLFDEEIIWETFVDIRMTVLGTDHLNGDRLFAAPMPSIPTFEHVMRSLELVCTGLDPQTAQDRFQRARQVIESTSLEECNVTLRVAAYEDMMPDEIDIADCPEEYAARAPHAKWSITLANGAEYDGRSALSVWSRLPFHCDADLDQGDGYTIQWPAARQMDHRPRLFTLRDGCLEEGNALISIGISLRLSLDKNAEPFLCYFDETEGAWRQRDFTRELGSNRGGSFIVTMLHIRRMLFVIGEKRTGSWIRSHMGEDFHIPYSGAFEVFPNGRIIDISTISVCPRVSGPFGIPTRHKKIWKCQEDPDLLHSGDVIFYDLSDEESVETVDVEALRSYSHENKGSDGSHDGGSRDGNDNDTGSDDEQREGPRTEEECTRRVASEPIIIVG